MRNGFISAAEVELNPTPGESYDAKDLENTFDLFAGRESDGLLPILR
jgi:hypothetical protein